MSLMSARVTYESRVGQLEIRITRPFFRRETISVSQESLTIQNEWLFRKRERTFASGEVRKMALLTELMRLGKRAASGELRQQIDAGTWPPRGGGSIPLPFGDAPAPALDWEARNATLFPMGIIQFQGERHGKRHWESFGRGLSEQQALKILGRLRGYLPEEVFTPL